MIQFYTYYGDYNYPDTSSLKDIYFIFLIIILIVSFIAASEFYNIAKMKGHDKVRYFWYCFLFTFIGYCMVISLPDLSRKNNSNTSFDNDSLPNI